jgi:hypothetical protein
MSLKYPTHSSLPDTGIQPGEVGTSLHIVGEQTSVAPASAPHVVQYVTHEEDLNLIDDDAALSLATGPTRKNNQPHVT